MQDSLSSVKGNARMPNPTKYRLACDSCQRSKIRCDQERPACRRCAKKGIECVYSPARRAGRPRTRNTNNSKSFSSVDTSVSASPKGHLTPMAEHCINIPTTGWMPPSPPTSITLSASEDCSSSNTSIIPDMAPPIQLLSPEDMPFSQYQSPGDEFLQGLLDFTGSHSSTPEQTTNGDYPMFPVFHIAPELLDLSFCGAPWEPQQQPQQQQQQKQEQHGQDHQQHHHAEQQQEDTSTSTPNNQNTDSYSYATTALQQQQQPQSPQHFNHAPPSTKSCNCISTLLDHLSAQPSHAPSSPSLSSTCAALTASKALLTCCQATIACPNVCSTRPSTALLICEAIDRALASLNLGGGSLWTPTPAPATCSETPSPLSSPSSLSSKSGSNSNNVLFSASVADEEHVPLRCGTLPIRGADRRAAVRVLLVKRMLEVQGVLERLRAALLSGPLVDGDTVGKERGGGGWALCADVVGEFAKKVAERVEVVKVQI